MSYQRGTNAGLSGTISIPGVGALFEVQIFKWKCRMLGTTKPRRGRGGGVYRTLRWIFSSGTGACSGKPNLDGWPAPNLWKGQTGTITVTIHTGKTIAYPVLITEMGFNYDEKTQDLPDVFFAWETTGEPTYTGWGSGSQPTATDPTKADQEQWEVTSKTYDTGGLQDAAEVFIDLWGTLGDTNSAETTKLIAVVTAAAIPMTGQKKRTATYARDALDGGTITLRTGLTTTDEDVINAATVLDVDPHGRTSQAATAVFNGTPSASAGLVVRGLTTKEYNDNKILYTKQHGTRSTIEDLTFGNTKKTHDVSALAEEDLMCLSFTTGTPPGDPDPPAGKVITGYFDVPDTSPDSTNLSYRVYILSFTSNEQKATLPHYQFEMDPNGLETVLHSAVVWDSGVEVPPDPDLPDGLVLVNITDLGIPTHPTKRIRVYRWGERTTADDATFPRTRVSTDNSALEQEDTIAVLFTTGGSPAVPTRAGMVVADYFDVPLTNAGASNLSVRINRMSYATNAQKITSPRYELATDPNGLDTVLRSAVIFDSGSPPGDPGLPSGLKLFSKTDHGLDSHPTKRVRVYQWEKNDSIDKLVLPHTFTTVDPSDIDGEGEVAGFNTTGSVPGGYKSRGTTGFYQNGVDLLNVTKFGKRSTADDITHGHTISRTRSFEGTTADTSSLLATSNTAAFEATQIFNTYKASVTWEGATVRKIHDGLAEIILHTRDAEIIVAGRSSGSRRVITPAYLSGSDVYVFMRRKIKIGSNLWEYELAEQYIAGEVIDFTIRRYVSGSTLPYHPDLLNTTNGSAFLGLSAGYVTYLGVAESLTNIAVAANRVSSMTWGFRYDSLGILDLADASPGWNWTNSDLTSVGPGWVTASSLGLSSSALGTGDYSVFTA